MAKVQGTCDERFAALQQAFQERIDAGDELGASITVNIDGKDVVDLWGGYKNPDRTELWEENTIVNVWSSSKTVIALATLMLVDRGLVDVNENVAKYWPEFAANGKENIKVKHFLSHTSGLSGWDEQLERADFFNREKLTRLLAEQAPWWEPGTASGYHAHTMGFLLGELVLRTTGKTITQFIADEIAGPLKADFQIGAKEEDWPRIADVYAGPGPALQLPEGIPDIIPRTLKNPVMSAEGCLTPEWRRAEISAANGHGNSRALAKILSAISLGGEVDGVRLLSPETIDLIWQEQAHGVDLILGKQVQFGIGYGLCVAGDSAVNMMLPQGKICFWSGWGGSMVVADTERRMTISYTMNRMYTGTGTLGNANTAAYLTTIYAALGAKPSLQQ